MASPAELEGSSQEQHKEEPDFFSVLLLQTFYEDVQDKMKTDLLPRAATVAADITSLQQDQQVVSQHAADEKAHLEAELNRLTSLVMSFQQAVAQFLPGLGS